MNFRSILLDNPFMILYAGLLILSLIRYRKYFDTPLRVLPVLLTYMLLTETFGLLIKYSPDFSLFMTDFHQNNNWFLYNVYGLLEFLVFFWIYSRYVTAFRIRYFVNIGLLAVLVVSLWNAWAYDFMTLSQVYSYWVSGTVTTVLCILYLLQEWTTTSRKYLIYNPLIWISIGLLIFTLIYIPIDYHRFLVVRDGIAYKAWTRPIHLSGIYIFYGCIFMGLLIMDEMKRPARK